MKNAENSHRIIQLIKNLKEVKATAKEIINTLQKGSVKDVPTHHVWISNIKNHSSKPPEVLLDQAETVIRVLEKYYSEFQNSDKSSISGEYSLYFSNTNPGFEAYEFNDRFSLTINGSSALIYSDQTNNKKALAYKGSVELVSGVACFNFDSTTERKDKINWIIRLREHKNNEYYSGLYLTINDNNGPSSGNVLIIRKNDKNYSDFIRGFFLTLTNIGSINLETFDVTKKDADLEMIRTSNKIDKLAGFWKAIRWNETESKFSCYCIEINKSGLAVKIYSQTCDFYGYLHVADNNRISIKAKDKTNDIEFTFTSLLPNVELDNLKLISGVFKRITNKNIRSGHMIIIRVNESFKGTRKSINEFSRSEAKHVKALVKDKTTISSI